MRNHSLENEHIKEEMSASTSQDVRKCRKVLHSEGKNIVNTVLKFFEDEAKYSGLIVPKNQPTRRTAIATGLSESTIKRIRKERSLLSQPKERLKSPPRRRKKSVSRKTIDLVDNFDRCVIRRTIHDFYAIDKKVPTLNKLLPVLKDKIDFMFGKTALHSILKQMGFKSKKTESKRKMLMERDDIVLWRTKYLRAIKHYRDCGKNIVFLDETWVDSNLTFGKCWKSEEIVESDHAGNRLIVVSAGNLNGLVPNSTLIYTAENTTSNGQMNQHKFETWLKTQLLPNIEPNSVVIFDNAPYHNVQQNKPPNWSSQKQEIVDWLVRNNIPFHFNMRKCELLEIIQRLNYPKIYTVDRILEEHGHIALRLPPYHCDLNPIELIWAQVKTFIRNVNSQGDLNMTHLMEYTSQGLGTINDERWKSCYECVLNLEQMYWETDSIMDEILESLILNTDESDSETETPLETDEDDDEMCIPAALVTIDVAS